MRFVTALLGASSVFALASSAFAADAGAQASVPTAASTVFDLGQITVAAPKVEGATVDANTLSSEAIYAFQRPTLDDAVNLIPGVVASNTGGSRNERVVSVRGFNRFQVPLLIDGIRVFLPADNRLDYGRFLTPDISEIQVAKGYVSVIDGPDGMGGAINLVTRKPTKEVEAEVRATLNTGHDVEYTGYNVFGLLGTKQDKWYAQGSYTRNLQDHWDLSDGFTPTANQGPGKRNLTHTGDWRMNVKAGFTPNSTDEYSINYTKQEGDKKAPLSTTDPIATQRFWTWPYWNIDSLYFLSSTALGDRVTFKTKIYRNTFDNLLSSFDNASENTQTRPYAFNSYYADEAHGGEAQLDWRITDGDTLNAAFNYRRDKHVEWQQSFPTGATEPKQTSIEDTYSVALENVEKWTSNLTFTTGLGYDWRELQQAQDYANNAFVYYPLKNKSAISWQGKLSWRPDETGELHFSISSRTRFPTLFDRFSSRFGGAVSNPDLKPERATNWEIGASKSLMGVQLDGAVFYSRLKDVIVQFPFIYTSCVGTVCTPNPVTQSRNLGHGEYYGFEVSASAKLTPSLTAGANYTFTHRDLNDPTNAAFRPTDVPTSKAFFYLDWRPVPRLHVLPSLDVASNRWTVNTAGTLYYRTGAYANGAIDLDYDLTDRIDVGVGVKNLFDDNYQLVDGFPEPGRSFFASVRARY